MTVLFICYWDISEALTTSTSIPCLQQLQDLKTVKKVVFSTCETISKKHEHKAFAERLQELGLSKVVYEPIRVRKRALLFFYLPPVLLELITFYKIQLIIGHGVFAGSLACKLAKRYRLPFYVSLFEPHANYMIESKVWSRLSLKYFILKYWEHQQKQFASGLMPVSEGYREKLMENGTESDKIKTIPCVVDAENFKFRADQREQIRRRLTWPEATIGIYVGKFGGLYYSDEAFSIYKKCFAYFPELRLILASPNEEEEIKELLLRHKVPIDKVFITSIPHHQVPQYLSAADFAFATYKPGPSKQFLSPVKIGEYWASGLPVLLTEGIGDDSDIIKREGGGALFDLEVEGSVEKAILEIQNIIKQPEHREQIRKLAIKYRSPDRIREAYEYFLGKKSDG